MDWSLFVSFESFNDFDATSETGRRTS